MSFTPSELGLTYPGGYIVTEVFEGTGLAVAAPDYTIEVSVNPNGVQLVRLELNVAREPVNVAERLEDAGYGVKDWGKTGEL